MGLSNLQIGLLVAMCVIFVLTASLLIFLILRWDRTSRKVRRYVKKEMEESVYLLHFIDLSKIPRSLDIREMPVQDEKSLQLAIASLCGLERPSMLSLKYINEVGCSVEVDLDQLVRRDEELGDRMRQTAICPLTLCRREEVVTPNGGKKGQQSEGLIIPRGSSEVEVNYRHGEGRVVPRHPERVDTGSGPSPRCVVPPPIIMPRRSHITSTTPVTIRAVQYLIENDGTVLGEDATNIIENAMHHGGRRTVKLPNGWQVVVEPETGTTWLFDASGGGRRRLLLQSAEVVRYSVDNMSASQWYLYRDPIFLPPGRWCVQVESSTADHRYVETSSRVFTVDMLERQR